MVILVASSHIVEKDLVCGEAFGHGYKERKIEDSERSSLVRFQYSLAQKIQAILGT